METARLCIGQDKNNSEDADLLLSSVQEPQVQESGIVNMQKLTKQRCIRKLQGHFSNTDLFKGESDPSYQCLYGSDKEDRLKNYVECFTNCFPQFCSDLEYEKLLGEEVEHVQSKNKQNKTKKEERRMADTPLSKSALNKVYFGRTNMCSTDASHTDMLNMTENSSGKKFFQAYKGQLHLSVNLQEKSLQVIVSEVKDLPKLGKNQKICIKANISGKASSRKTGQTSALNYQCKAEGISLKLKKKDFQERLVISVCKDDCSDVIGCTSFSLHKLQRLKSVAGWYYLLAEDLGNLKHMKVTDRKVDEHHNRVKTGSDSDSSGYGGSNSDCSQQQSDKESECESRVKIHIVLIHKDKVSGYGLSLVDTDPGKVSRVKAGSPAEIAGVRRGDRVLRINGQSVRGMSSQCIGRIIRHHHKIIIHVQRLVSEDHSVFDI